MVPVLNIILGLVIIVGLCPFLGRKLYKMKKKKLLTIFMIFSILFLIPAFLLSTHATWDVIVLNIKNYFDGVFHFEWTIIFTLITFITSGIGIVGGILEYSGEHTESEEAYQKFHNMAPVKIYFYSLMYGYIFIFAIFSFNAFISILLIWDYSEIHIFLIDFITVLQFSNIVIVIFGNILFSIKSFRYGIFSAEFYRSEFHPSVADLKGTQREIRHIIACVVGTIGIYCCGLIYLLEKNPSSTLDLSFGRFFFYLAAFLEAIIFFAYKDKFIDQLKPLKQQYELKVGKGPLTDQESKDISNDPEDDLRFP
jgi:hypothetical protein